MLKNIFIYRIIFLENEGDSVKKDMNKTGVLILIGLFILFYVVTIFFLDKRNISKEVPQVDDTTIKEDTNNESAKEIINNLYKDARVLYDVVNNKFTVDQSDTIVIGNITYKKITNFEDVMAKLFTLKGEKKYIETLGNYFAYTEDGYYLAGNLVSYQTYYFRGDNTNIYITEADTNKIKGIIYEKWTTNNRNTLATIDVVKENDKWLIDNIEILSNE